MWGRFALFVPYPSPCQGNLSSLNSINCQPVDFGGGFALKSGDESAEITYMLFGITDLYFPGRRRPGKWVAPGAAAAWNGVASPGELGRPGDLPVPARQQVRRWGALLALAAMTLPGAGVARADDRRPPAQVAAGVETSRSQGSRPAGSSTAAGGIHLPPPTAAAPAAAAPWEAGVVESDGKPLPTAPPPGPVPVNGTPKPATAAPAAAAGTGAAAAGSTSAGDADDLVPADREYLRPILIRYAQENGLPADLVMALAWVESSWRRTALSDGGAKGVMQLMPVTVTYASQKLLGLKGNLDPYNATSNIRMGTKFLRHLLDQYHGNVRQALIAYNQGQTSLQAQGSYGAAERYADRVIALRSQFRSA
jgi:soluble lytic murein transglycosylase-like protein